MNVYTSDTILSHSLTRPSIELTNRSFSVGKKKLSRLVQYLIIILCFAAAVVVFSLSLSGVFTCKLTIDKH